MTYYVLTYCHGTRYGDNQDTMASLFPHCHENNQFHGVLEFIQLNEVDYVLHRVKFWNRLLPDMQLYACTVCNSYCRYVCLAVLMLGDIYFLLFSYYMLFSR